MSLTYSIHGFFDINVYTRITLLDTCVSHIFERPFLKYWAETAHKIFAILLLWNCSNIFISCIFHSKNSFQLNILLSSACNHFSFFHINFPILLLHEIRERKVDLVFEVPKHHNNAILDQNSSLNQLAKNQHERPNSHSNRADSLVLTIPTTCYLMLRAAAGIRGHQLFCVEALDYTWQSTHGQIAIQQYACENMPRMLDIFSFEIHRHLHSVHGNRKYDLCIYYFCVFLVNSVLRCIFSR